MPNKKYYFVLSPSSRHEELREKAANYYGVKDYDSVDNHSDFMSVMKTVLPNPDISFNVSLMLIGVSAVSLALCDSVYISKDWETDDICKVCHALAFSHGLDIVYES